MLMSFCVVLGAPAAIPAAAASPAAAAPPAPTPPPIAATPLPSPARPLTAVEQRGPRVYASPMAKRLAEAQALRLEGQGSGAYGSITSKDLGSLSSGSAAASTPISIPPGAAYVDIPVSNTRAVIAKRLLESKVTIPHYYLTVDINVDKVSVNYHMFTMHPLARHFISIFIFTYSLQNFVQISTSNWKRKVLNCRSMISSSRPQHWHRRKYQKPIHHGTAVSFDSKIFECQNEILCEQ